MKVKYQGVPHQLDLFVTVDDKVIIFSPAQANYETLELVQEDTVDDQTADQNSGSGSLSNHSQSSSRCSGLNGNLSAFPTFTSRPTDSGAPVSAFGRGSFNSSFLRGKVLQFNPALNGQVEVDLQYDDYAPTLGQYKSERKIFGIVGILDIGVAKHLFFIKKHDKVTSIREKSVFKIVEGDHVCIYRNSYLTLSEEQIESDSIRGILSLLSSGNFYFSYDYDLTNSSQRYFDKISKLSGSGAKTVYLSDTCDEMFWWNRYLISPLMETSNLSCKEFILPIICGYVGGVSIPPTDETMSAVEYFLIARMSTRRVGTRYNRRGLDVHGNSAIYVETETILQSLGRLSSYVIIRASVPWLWKQDMQTLQYKPTINLEPLSSKSAQETLELHFHSLLSRYDAPVSCVNLLDKSGFEQRLDSTFQDSIKRLQNLEKFDGDVEYFTASLNEGGNPLRRSAHVRAAAASLLQGIERSLLVQKYFSASVVSACRIQSSFSLNESRLFGSSPAHSTDLVTVSINSRQLGIFRVNCLDCLDRTNMIQYLVCSRKFMDMLGGIGSTNSDDMYSADLALVFQSSLGLYRNIWVEHGNAISVQYAGTPALHGNFISSEHRGISYSRPFKSIIAKFSNSALSISRFYLNLLIDSERQDTFDQFLGYHRKDISPEQYVRRIEKTQRKQSYEPILHLISERDLGSIWNRLDHNISRKITSLLILCLRHVAPHSIDSNFSFICALFWMFTIAIWNRLIGKRYGWTIVRTPKSPSPFWEGDDNL